MWNQEANKAFQQLKEAITSVPVLALLNFSNVFTIETDALGFGLGAILI